MGDFPASVQHCNIGCKELFAIAATARHFDPALASRQVELYCDNQPAVFMLRHLKTHSFMALLFLHDIVKVFLALHCHLSVL